MYNISRDNLIYLIYKMQLITILQLKTAVIYQLLKSMKQLMASNLWNMTNGMAVRLYTQIVYCCRVKYMSWTCCFISYCYAQAWYKQNAKESIQCNENYRGIALCSSDLSKVFDNIMIQRFSDKSMSSDVQFSFKAQHSIVMCTCAVKEIAAYHNERGSNVYVSMLAASKAFDQVNFVQLFSWLTEIFPGFSFA